ncbi:MAG: hypothetical protein ABSA71_09100 [Desulfomonilia bacterium]
MIALKSSTSDGSSFRVYDDEKLLGYIRKQRGLTGDKYLASIDRNGEEESNKKDFDSPDDALQWIEKQI